MNLNVTELNNSLLEKLRAHFCAAKIVCVKFKVALLCRFCTGARRVVTTHKSFINKIPLTVKTATVSTR